MVQLEAARVWPSLLTHILVLFLAIGTQDSYHLKAENWWQCYNKTLWSYDSVSGTILSILHVLIHFIFITVWGGYYQYVTNQETEARIGYLCLFMKTLRSARAEAEFYSSLYSEHVAQRLAKNKDAFVE